MMFSLFPRIEYPNRIFYLDRSYRLSSSSQTTSNRSAAMPIRGIQKRIIVIPRRKRRPKCINMLQTNFFAIFAQPLLECLPEIVIGQPFGLSRVGTLYGFV